jgi:haloacid dehalogenase-like hydrolase/Oligopeptide/dipeptide transporter, C-terminal region
MFALERVGKLAPQHLEWKEKQPFKAVLEHDQGAMSKFTESDWMKIIAATHAGMSTEAFQRLVKDWLATAKAPRFARPYTDLIYQPMLEVMKYLRANGFRTYIVTGGGQEFVRVYSEQVYGVPPERDRKRHMSMLFISHDLPAIAGLCHRLAILHEGEIVECGPVKSVLAAPIHPYTKRLIAAVPKWEVTADTSCKGRDH